MNHDHPLDLTVHALPHPERAGQSAQRTRSGRWKMLLVLLVCAAPVVASYLTYYVLRPEARAVSGTLIDPQRPLPDLVGLAPDGRAVNLRSLKGQWLLVMVAGGACNAACQSNLYLQRQLRESLGKEKERVDRVWLVSDAAPLDSSLLPALAQATVLRVAPQALAQWLAPQPGHALGDHLFVVDPLGNWMLRFAPGLDIKGASQAKRDLDRVLRASASWDEAGR